VFQTLTQVSKSTLRKEIEKQKNILKISTESYKEELITNYHNA